MQKIIQAIRGMNDILPDQISYWQFVEKTFHDIMNAYGYAEIRLPIVENTEVFTLSIGSVTDIVEKEMYSFTDRNGEQLSLRPEGTASCVRAGIEHGLFYNQIQRLWYRGPMFRHERPQKGRYRQFYQLGAECFGLAGPAIDAELIFLLYRFWQRLAIHDYLTLQINSLGNITSRNQYRTALVDYLNDHFEQLDEDSKRRLHTNPLRILDSKNPQMQDVLNKAPAFAAYLDEESKQHFAGLKALLDAGNISYTVNPRLVRGLDYYCKTAFEWVTDRLGAQATVCGGGRYDGLVEQRGGKPTPAVGFSVGIERLVLLLEQSLTLHALQQPLHAYVILVGEQALLQGMIIAEKLRSQIPQLNLLCNGDGGSFKTQFKKADKSGAQVALILGDSEVERGTIAIKPLRLEEMQQEVDFEKCVNYLKKLVNDPQAK